MLCQTCSSSPKSSLGQLLNYQGYEGDEKHDEDRDDTTENPVEDWRRCWHNRLGKWDP